MSHQITTLKDLDSRLSLTDNERAWHESAVSMPLGISEYYLSLIDPSDPADPIRRQAVPTSDENCARGWLRPASAEISPTRCASAGDRGQNSCSEDSQRASRCVTSGAEVSKCGRRQIDCSNEVTQGVRIMPSSELYAENNKKKSDAMAEFPCAAFESLDPLQEVLHSKGNRLIHRFRNRVAFLATDICATYCRHCFRRRFTGGLQGPATEADVEEACRYIGGHPEIREMLLTGGDPLTLERSRLEMMVSSFRKARESLVIRICTRIPVTDPGRVTPELVEVFTRHSGAPFFLMTQFNHPRELTPLSVRAVGMFIDRGIPAFNQSVLLRGVNDDPDVLDDLCNGLLFARIKPYYLFQTDLVSGTASFRVPIERGMEIERALRCRLSGLAMPSYTLDLPDGGGKVPLCGSYVDGIDGNVCTLHNPDGETRLYPAL